MRAAIYARVSSEHQERQQTIDSQLTALRAWAATNGHTLVEEHVFRDEGYSGARLDRPGLDALRDAVRDVLVDVVAVFAPDRLARKYAYQVLLLEEFRRAGCEVVFLQHPISDDPNDQLLLQIQGAIAEYERAVLAERFRRGKLQRARDGQYLGGKAPYGYRYIRRQDGVAGHLVIDEAEAEMVRTLYTWFVDDQLTIRQVAWRLYASAWHPRGAGRVWATSTIHHILADPVYTGTAYVNRYDYVPAKKPRTHGPRTGEPTVRRLKPRERWIPIPVPALIEQALWDRAQAQLARNSQFAARHWRQKHRYLLRCLLTCAHCGLSMHGRTIGARPRYPEQRVYVCQGKDRLRCPHGTICPSRLVHIDALDRAVWEHVAGLLRDPAQLAAQFEQIVAAAGAGTAQMQAADRQLAQRLARLTQADTRLVDAYQAGTLTLAELTPRRAAIAEQQRALAQQQAERERLRAQRGQAETVLASLTDFAARVGARLGDATFEERQAILQLVVERVIVSEDTLEIRHVIPLRPPPDGSRPRPPAPASAESSRPSSRLRSDGVRQPSGCSSCSGVTVSSNQPCCADLLRPPCHASSPGSLPRRTPRHGGRGNATAHGPAPWAVGAAVRAPHAGDARVNDLALPHWS
jgi:site-specific DNA recombinase